MAKEEILPAPPCRDKLGQFLEVGDVIAYGHAMGRSSGLRIGRVLNIRAYHRFHNHPDKVDWSITVLGIDDDWSHRPPTLNERTGTLLYPNRTIRLPRDIVPLEYLHLLEVI